MQKSSIFMCLIFKGFSSLQKIIRLPHRAPKCPASTPQTGLSRFFQPTSWEVAILNNLLKQFVTHLLCCIYDEIRPNIPGILLFLTQS